MAKSYAGWQILLGSAHNRVICFKPEIGQLDTPFLRFILFSLFIILCLHFGTNVPIPCDSYEKNQIHDENQNQIHAIHQKNGNYNRIAIINVMNEMSLLFFLLLYFIIIIITIIIIVLHYFALVFLSRFQCVLLNGKSSKTPLK